MAQIKVFVTQDIQHRLLMLCLLHKAARFITNVASMLHITHTGLCLNV